MEGKPTAEWIGLCMKDAKQTESAMKQIADRAERHLRQISVPTKGLQSCRPAGQRFAASNRFDPLSV
jgi:hypothetical protein